MLSLLCMAEIAHAEGFKVYEGPDGNIFIGENLPPELASQGYKLKGKRSYNAGPTVSIPEPPIEQQIESEIDRLKWQKEQEALEQKRLEQEAFDKKMRESFERLHSIIKDKMDLRWENKKFFTGDYEYWKNGKKQKFNLNKMEMSPLHYGMTEKEVLNKWDEPKSRYTYSTGARWGYPLGVYLIFTDGKLTSWRTH